jgi:hypothetical protein
LVERLHGPVEHGHSWYVHVLPVVDFLLVTHAKMARLS